MTTPDPKPSPNHRSFLTRASLVIAGVFLAALAIGLIIGHENRRDSQKTASVQKPSAITSTGLTGVDKRKLPSDTVALYVSTELGRKVICYQLWESTSAGLSCDWTLYHHRYGFGDPFDGKP